MNKKFITTPIYYVNDSPHIGHAYTSVVCDVYARFFMLKNLEVIFLTGTDEHGQKVENAAKENGIEPIDFVNSVSQNFIELTHHLNISNTDFIRTTEDRHKKTVEIIWQKLLENDEIYLDNYEGWYSIKDESFYQEKELQKQKGEFLTKDGSKVEWLKEESYFFKLSKWEKKLLSFYNENSDFIQPKSRRNEVISFVKSGLKDLSISRTSFKWGIPVPNQSSGHIIYVWIDALTNYLSALNYYDNENPKKDFWNESVHVIGKDILKFHAVYWPALLMAIGLNPPKKIFAHGWWTNEGKKISKSLNNSIDPKKIIDEYGLDQFRFFILREITLGQDGDFSEKSLLNRSNSDLSNSLGNLFQRTLKFLEKHFESKMPLNIDKFDLTILNNGYYLLNSIEQNIENFEYHKALEIIWKYIADLNQFIDEQKPWSTIKEDKKKTAETLSVLMESLRLVGIILQPFIPGTAKRILDTLNIKENERSFEFFNKDFSLKEGVSFKKVEQLFPKLDE